MNLPAVNVASSQLAWYLSQPFAWHALLATVLVGISAGLIAPFVLSRRLAFAVHGTSELAFTGAAAGLLVAGNPLLGALVGSLVVASVIGALGDRAESRDSTIGVVLAFGLGLGVLLLSFYHGFATAATNILFGNLLGVSGGQLLSLVLLSIGVLVAMAFIYRPLLFASIDPEVAAARGVPTRLLGLVFLYILALTVTQAAQIVGTLLVLSLAITPAAAARQLTARPAVLSALSVLFAATAGAGGLLASLAFGSVKPSVLITSFSFVIYIACRLLRPPAGQRG